RLVFGSRPRGGGVHRRPPGGGAVASRESWRCPPRVCQAPSPTARIPAGAGLAPCNERPTGSTSDRRRRPPRAARPEEQLGQSGHDRDVAEPGGKRGKQPKRAVQFLLVTEPGQLIGIRARRGHGAPPLASAPAAAAGGQTAATRDSSIMSRTATPLKCCYNRVEATGGRPGPVALSTTTRTTIRTAPQPGAFSGQHRASADRARQAGAQGPDPPGNSGSQAPRR